MSMEERESPSASSGELPSESEQEPPSTPEHEFPGMMTHLPGGIMTMTIDPPVPSLVSHKKARYLHGALTTIIGAEFSEAYTAERAGFALIPRPSINTWDVWMAGNRSVALAKQSRSLTWDADRPRDRVISFGPLTRLRVPPYPPKDMYRVAIRTETPLAVLSKRTKDLASLFDDKSAVGVLINIRRRLCMQTPWFHASADSHELDPLVINVKGGTWCRMTGVPGHVGCLHGRLTVFVDHHGLWLLRVAEMIGLGGYTSIGFGRVRVEVL